MRPSGDSIERHRHHGLQVSPPCPGLLQSTNSSISTSSDRVVPEQEADSRAIPNQASDVRTEENETDTRFRLLTDLLLQLQVASVRLRMMLSEVVIAICHLAK